MTDNGLDLQGAMQLARRAMWTIEQAAEFSRRVACLFKVSGRTGGRSAFAAAGLHFMSCSANHEPRVVETGYDTALRTRQQQTSRLSSAPAATTNAVMALPQSCCGVHPAH